MVLDSKLRLSPKCRIVRTSDDDLLVFTALQPNSPKARKLQNAGVEVLPTKLKNGRIDLSLVLAELGRRDILSVLLEAGPALNGAALAAGIVHKLVLFYAPKIAGDNSVPFAFAPKLNLPLLRSLRMQQFGPDFAIEATGDPEKLDEFIDVMRSYGEIEVVRSGGVAMSLETKKLRLQPPVQAPIPQAS